MSFIIPEVRTRDALAATEKRLFDADDHREIGYSAIVYHRAPDILIPDNDGPIGNAKRFALARNKEDQADAGIPYHVVEGLDTTVTAPIRYSKGRVINTPYESRAISLWRQINEAERIDRAHDSEWRCGDKAVTSTIELVENLAGEQPVGRPDNISQIRFCCDHIAEPLMKRCRH